MKAIDDGLNKYQRYEAKRRVLVNVKSVAESEECRTLDRMLRELSLIYGTRIDAAKQAIRHLHRSHERGKL